MKITNQNFFMETAGVDTRFLHTGERVTHTAYLRREYRTGDYVVVLWDREAKNGNILFSTVDEGIARRFFEKTTPNMA